MVTRLQDVVIGGGLLGDMHIQKTTASTNKCRLRHLSQPQAEGVRRLEAPCVTDPLLRGHETTPCGQPTTCYARVHVLHILSR